MDNRAPRDEDEFVPPRDMDEFHEIWEVFDDRDYRPTKPLAFGMVMLWTLIVLAIAAIKIFL